MKILLKKSINLETLARNIFGDIVKTAYFCSDYQDIAEAKRELRDFDNSCNPFSDIIDNGSKDIVLEFVNGRKVRFTNSEWGEIQEIRDILDDTFVEVL
jgi:hypothetical protein